VSQDSSPLDIAIVRAASVVTVNVAGDLDIATGRSLADQVGAVMADGPPGELILNVAELRFCDSAGINALVRLRKLADQHGWRFAMVHPQSQVRRVLELTGLRDYLNLESEATT
jgi:anti-sigma B factor antagonist